MRMSGIMMGNENVRSHGDEKGECQGSRWNREFFRARDLPESIRGHDEIQNFSGLMICLSVLGVTM